jgi:hypothetical protein
MNTLNKYTGFIVAPFVALVILFSVNVYYLHQVDINTGLKLFLLLYVLMLMISTSLFYNLNLLTKKTLQNNILTANFGAGLTYCFIALMLWEKVPGLRSLFEVLEFNLSVLASVLTYGIVLWYLSNAMARK